MDLSGQQGLPELKAVKMAEGSVGWLARSLWERSLSHSPQPTAQLSPCPVLLQVSVLPATLQHSLQTPLHLSAHSWCSSHLALLLFNACISRSFTLLFSSAQLGATVALGGYLRNAALIVYSACLFHLTFLNEKTSQVMAGNNKSISVTCSQPHIRCQNQYIVYSALYSEKEMPFDICTVTESTGCDSDWRGLYSQPKHPRNHSVNVILPSGMRSWILCQKNIPFKHTYCSPWVDL